MVRLAFLDFEASSLRKKSWPVEVAWVFDDGSSENHLIRPVPAWSDWDDKAERIHGISRRQLAEEGTPADQVAARMLEQLSGAALFATAPSWDGKWLSVLLRGGGLPRHALRLEDTTVAHRRAVLGTLQAAGVPAEEHGTLLREVLAAAERQLTPGGTPVHRALADARQEFELWRSIKAFAAASVTRP